MMCPQRGYDIRTTVGCRQSKIEGRLPLELKGSEVIPMETELCSQGKHIQCFNTVYE